MQQLCVKYMAASYNISEAQLTKSVKFPNFN